MKYGYIAAGTVNKGTFETLNDSIYGDFVFGENKESVENTMNEVSRNSDNGKTFWHVTRKDVESFLGRNFVTVTSGQRAGYCMSENDYTRYEMEQS